MDNLVYNYDTGNKLLKVTDNANDTYGFKDGTNTSNDYAYDLNGNMVQDLNKGITNVGYNHLNMPANITVTGSNAGTLGYVYDATGIKLRKANNNGTTTDYIGNFVYENGNLKQISQPEGYIEPDGSSYQYVYYMKDHQNNVRVTFADDNNNGVIETGSSYSEIRREQNYYPFGMEHRGYNNVAQGAKNNLKTYQDQEFTEDLGLDTHEWKFRISDPAIGRFWQVDPLAEKYSYNGTYNFSENRVIDGVELEGLEWKNADGKLIYDPNQDNGNGTKGGYTEHATQTDKDLGNYLQQTEKGTEQFNKLVNSTSPTTVILNETETPKNKKGDLILGNTKTVFKTETEVNFKTGESKEVITGVKSSEITLFAKNIKVIGDVLNDGNIETNQGIGINGKQLNEGSNVGNIIGVVLGHEIEHRTLENALAGDIEIVPTQVSDKIIGEINNKPK